LNSKVLEVLSEIRRRGGDPGFLFARHWLVGQWLIHLRRAFSDEAERARRRARLIHREKRLIHFLQTKITAPRFPESQTVMRLEAQANRRELDKVLQPTERDIDRWRRAYGILKDKKARGSAHPFWSHLQESLVSDLLPLGIQETGAQRLAARLLHLTWPRFISARLAESLRVRSYGITTRRARPS
jgi:hypothetical protein